MYECFLKLMNDMDRYEVEYDLLCDFLLQNEVNVNASKAKRVAKAHEPLSLVANTYASSSNSRSPPTYYVTNPHLVNDSDDDTQSYAYQGEPQRDDQEDKLTTAMMLLACAITQHYSTPTNNHLKTSSNTRRNTSRNVGSSGNDAYVQNTNGNTATVQRVSRTTANSGHTPTVQCYNCNEKGHLARECPKPKVHDSNYFKQQTLLTKQDESGIHLDDKQNDFLLAYIPKDEELQELNASCIMMARIQTIANDSDVEPLYDSDFVNEVQDPSSKLLEGLFSNNDHEQSHHEQHETINPTYHDDHIIFDDPNEGVNSDNVEQDNHAYNQQRTELESLLINEQIKSANTQRISVEVKKANALLTNELETYKECVWFFKNKPGNKYDYKIAYNEALNREKKLKDKIKTQFLVEKRKTEVFEKEKHDLTIKSLIQVNNILLLQKEHESLKENFKKQEDKYLDDILRLEAKLKDHERPVYKIDDSFQTIHMLGPKPNSFYDPMQVNLHDSEEIIKDAKKSRLKMKEKQKDDEVQKKKVTMFPIDHAK
ncbi:retrovirus-related pol polyprotein from transposon TNT 1-94 [Tanacetum coccineum]